MAKPAPRSVSKLLLLGLVIGLLFWACFSAARVLRLQNLQAAHLPAFGDLVVARLNEQPPRLADLAAPPLQARLFFEAEDLRAWQAYQPYYRIHPWQTGQVRIHLWRAQHQLVARSQMQAGPNALVSIELHWRWHEQQPQLLDIVLDLEPWAGS